MPKSTKFKSVVVKEDPKTSLRAAKIHPLRLKNGAKVAAIGHLYWPYHDRNFFDLFLQYCRDEKPDVVLLLGGIFSESAWKSLWENEDNYVHDYPEVPEVVEARSAGIFEDRVRALCDRGREEVFDRITETGVKLVLWVPSWTHLSMENEVRLTEWIQFTKRFLDGWMTNHPDASDILSDPDDVLPKELDVLFGLTDNPKVKMLRYGAGVKVNDDVLFMIGDFRRRNPADSSLVEWRNRNSSIVRSFDGKVASWWMTTPDDTLPGLKLKYWQGHEIGYMWDPIQMAHLRDYDFRAPGFWTGRIVFGKVVGKSVLLRRGDDGRRSFVVSGKPYTEETPGCTWTGEEIEVPEELAPEDEV